MAYTPGKLIDAFLPPALGTYVPPDPDTVPTGVPNRLTSGLAARDRQRAENTLTLIRAGVGGTFVSQVYWSEIQPVKGAGLRESVVQALLNDLDWAKANNLGVLIRTYAGAYAPGWAFTDAGSLTWYTNDGSLGSGVGAPSNSLWHQIPTGIPIWWDPGYAAAYASLVADYAGDARIVTHPALCGFTVSGPMTQYAEPMIKQFALAENRAAALTAGYTLAKDLAAFSTAFDAHKAHLVPAGAASYLACSTFQSATYKTDGSTSMTGDDQQTIAVMEDFKTRLGGFAVMENNSLEYAPATSGPVDADGDYPMYVRQLEMHAGTPSSPLHYQTKTLAKHAADYDAGDQGISPLNTAKMAINAWGAGCVELPAGAEAANSRWPTITVSDTAALNAQGAANCVGLDVYHKGGPPVAVVPAPKRGWVEDGAYADNGPSPVSVVRMPSQAFVDAGMRHVVLGVGIKEIITTTAAGVVSYVPGSLEQRLAPVVDWNATHPTQQLTAHIRLHAGIRAPDVWRTICGEVVINNDTFGSGGPIPIWWNLPYKNLYASMWAVLGPIIDGIACVGSVNQPGHAMSYPEPFLLYTGQDNGNLAALSAAGFTVEAHKAWFRWFSASATSVARKVVYLDLNPAGFPTNTGTTGPTEEAFLQECANILIGARPPGLAGLENYSYAVDRVNNAGPYQRMYEFMLTKATVAWLNVQEARSQRIATPNPPTVRVWDTLAWQWLNAGGHSVETTGENPNTTYVNRWPEGFIGFLPTMTAQQAKAESNPGPTP